MLVESVIRVRRVRAEGVHRHEAAVRLTRDRRDGEVAIGVQE